MCPRWRWSAGPRPASSSIGRAPPCRPRPNSRGSRVAEALMERGAPGPGAQRGVVPGPILYIAGVLPKLSETFVYREVFALRERGVRVPVASVHPPETRLGDPGLEALAAEAIPVYGHGAARLIVDSLLEFLHHPLRAAGTKLLAFRDAILSRDVTLARRPRLLWQAIGALALARRVRPLE